MTLLSATLAILVQTATAPPDLSWMAGYWLECSAEREVSETWTDARAGVLVGAAVTTASGRTAFEYARIAPVNGILAYVAQPGGLPPTAFPLVEASGSRVVFANRDNDFPQRIIYERTGDVLTARIEGSPGDRQQAMDWRFDRTELNTRCPLP
jgi:hypothetical protein